MEAIVPQEALTIDHFSSFVINLGVEKKRIEREVAPLLYIF